MKSIDNEGFVTVPFPNDEEIVYILCFKPTIESNLIPFYVGESRRGTRRIGDYLTAQFAAATDFKVGTAVRVLQEQGLEVFVRYKPSVRAR